MDPATKKAMADFKGSLAKLVVNVLGKYNKVDCKVGRIMDNNDFKYIARKVSLQQNVQFHLFLAPFKLLDDGMTSRYTSVVGIPYRHFKCRKTFTRPPLICDLRIFSSILIYFS